MTTCPKCHHELIKTKAGSMCLGCGYAHDLKPLAPHVHHVALAVDRTEEGHPIPPAFQGAEAVAEPKPAHHPAHKADARKPHHSAEHTKH